jgi:hypothetical protein
LTTSTAELDFVLIRASALLRHELLQLLDYCELPFENECLHFYANPRGVQTASAEQVRQPIFTESIDHWRHFETWLGPLKEALGDLA